MDLGAEVPMSICGTDLKFLCTTNLKDISPLHKYSHSQEYLWDIGFFYPNPISWYSLIHTSTLKYTSEKNKMENKVSTVSCHRWTCLLKEVKLICSLLADTFQEQFLLK